MTVRLRRGRTRIRRAISGPWALAALAFTSCSSPTGANPNAPASVVVTPSSALLVSIGDTVVMTASVTSVGGQALSQPVTWSSADAGVAQVDASGRVVATGNGIVAITAAVGTLSATGSVTVEQRADSIVTSGDAQAADVGSPLDSAIVVTLFDARAHPIVGAPVSFTARAGSVSPAQATTDVGGSASTHWTLGTGSGLQELDVVGGFGDEAARVLSANGYALAAETLTLHSGDDQTELTGLALPEPLRVQALDQYGNGVPDVVVLFAADGDAALAAGEVVTDLDGIASVALTLGSALGGYTMTADVPDSLTATGLPLAGSPVTFTAEAVAYTLDAVAELTVGDTVTLTGSGFHAVPDSNSVHLDGVPATIVGGSQTELSVEVPGFGCTPAQVRDLEVSRTAATTSHAVDVRPVGVVELDVGEHALVGNPEAFCLQFLSATDDEYLVGLTATHWLDASTTFALTGADSAGPAPSPPVAPPAAVSESPLARPVAAGETKLRSAELALVERLQSASFSLSGPALSGPAAAPPTAGEILTLRLPDLRADPCTAYLPITAEVFSVGARLALATSVTLPGSQDPGMVELLQAANALHASYGDTGVDLLTDLLGAPVGWDADTRVVIVLASDVTLMGVPAYASAVDQLPRSTCPSSDEALIVYVSVPAAATTSDLAATLGASAPELTHHIAHILQWGRALPAGGYPLPTWLAEGQAELAVEAIGLALHGLGGQQDLGSAALSLPGLSAWIVERFDRLALFNGWDGAAGTVAGAPEGCSLFGFGGATSPCDPESAPGAAWSFLRYVSDRFGPPFAGGESGLHQALTGLESSGDPVGDLEALLGTTLPELVVDWAASLYVDGRIDPALAPDLQWTSWKLLELLPSGPMRLAPSSFGFADFARAGALVGGGTAYTLVTSSGTHGSLAVAATDAAGGAIAEMLGPRLWVVRMR